MSLATRETPQPSRIRRAVIDSSALFSALILNYERLDMDTPPRAQFASCLKEPLKERGAQHEFLQLLASIDKKLTTSHAIAELLGLQRSRLKLHGDDLLGFWQKSVELLLLWNIDEQLVRLLDLARDDRFQDRLPEIGFVDTGLIDLAFRNGCVLITEDETTLAPLAWELQVDCRLVKQLVPTVFQ